MTTTPRRRKSDRGPWANIRHILSDGDIGLVLVLGGCGLIVWALMGMLTMAGQTDMIAYAAMFKVGTPMAWFWIYVAAGVGLIYLAAYYLPPLPSLIIGGFVMVIWAWAFWARSTAVATQQTGNATSLIYMVIGALVLQRSGRSK